MRTRIRLLLPVIMVAILASLVVVPRVAWAHEGEHEGDESTQATTIQTTADDDTNTEQQSKAEEHAAKLQALREKMAQKRQEALAKAKEHMSDAQKKGQAKFQAACEERHTTYKTRLASVKSRATKHVETLDTIVERVETFVSDKSLDVPNYDGLLSEVKTQRALVRTLQETLAQKAAAFDCGNSKDEAKAALADFKDVFNQEVDAIKAYKSAVKKLIAAVKPVAKAAKRGASDDSTN